ncbi:MAG TPA: hypothetical protein VGR73_08295 [Bryobacteraceae bacterium]|nr:hypothetical protein [Bryobacteraceae bacterium]
MIGDIEKPQYDYGAPAADEMYHSVRAGGADVLADAAPELRREVEKLLAQYASGGKFGWIVSEWSGTRKLLLAELST